jgi:predicted  nucleic acid-binding Zn-ribbon protein
MRQRQAYAQLQRQVESLESEKRQLETRIHEFKSRLSNLQQELDNSVAVQNDFVRLSQSLQMELEKIRSQATEVSLDYLISGKLSLENTFFLSNFIPSNYIPSKMQI